MTDLRTLHRAADQELADEGGIAPLDDDRNLRNTVPLTDMPGSWRTFAIWAVLLTGSVILFSVAAHWFWSEFVSEAVRTVSGEG